MDQPSRPPPLLDGMYCRIHDDAVPRPSGRPALFLDRDGVIVELVDYLHRPEDVRLIPGADSAIERFNRAGVPVVVVTNQSGIGRGLYGWPEFVHTEEEIARLLARGGARLDAVLACPFHADGRPPYAHPDHPFRKPNPGMFHLARDRLSLDLGASWLVGDNRSDVEAAARAGLAGVVHVLTGHGAETRPEVETWVAAGRSVQLADSLPAATPMLLARLARGVKP